MPLYRTAALLISAGLALASASAPAAAQELEAVQGLHRHRNAALQRHLRQHARLRARHRHLQLSRSHRRRHRTGERQPRGRGDHIDGARPTHRPAIRSPARSRRPGQSNFGQYLWQFSNGTLTLLGTPETGGFQLTVRIHARGQGHRLHRCRALCCGQQSRHQSLAARIRRPGHHRRHAADRVELRGEHELKKPDGFRRPAGLFRFSGTRSDAKPNPLLPIACWSAPLFAKSISAASARPARC